MPPRFLALPFLLILFSGCTLAAQATPGEPTAVNPSQPGTATVQALSPVEAARAALQNLYGADGVNSVVAQIASTENGLVVTLAHPATTLGSAEAYWQVCRALVGAVTQPAGTVPAVLVAQPDGRVVVRADVNEGSCKLG